MRGEGLLSIDLEEVACRPVPIAANGFNPSAILPYGVSVAHIRAAMEEFIDWLGFINLQMHSRELPRFESMLMPANFSSIVGEFMTATIPKHSPGVVKNQYHNGHPDMLPAGMFPGESAQLVVLGFEVKGSRYH